MVVAGAWSEPTRRVLFLSAGLASLILAALAACAAPPVVNAVLAGAIAVGGLAALEVALVGRLPTPAEAARDFIVIALFGAARDPEAHIWQVPAQWVDIVRLTIPGVAVSCTIYFVAALAALTRAHRHLALRESLSALLIPLLFNLVLSLGASGLMGELGSVAVGRSIILAVFLEGLVGALGIVMSGRLSRDMRLHGLLIGTAIHAALSSQIADLPQIAAAAGWFADFLVAIASAALAQAGLWAIVFVATGLAIDSMHGTPPTFAIAYYHWKNGFAKGAIYGGVFITVLLLAAAALRTPLLADAAKSIPFLAAAIAGGLLFPLAATVVASADGTPPFFGRLIANYSRPRPYLRGIIVGIGATLALSSGLRFEGGLTRFLALFFLGALAYGGVDLFHDIFDKLCGKRRVLDNWHAYALGVLLGGLVGGALGWYFDAAQIDVVMAKFWAYTDLDYARVGRPANPFVIYPWFNKWGSLDLGVAGGGVRLFYDESLSGVINWSIAAPLFSINFFLLAAVFQRSLSPIKRMLSFEGFQGLVEQTVRVLRWGLWMAPVINSFLRQSPSPSWYNQDGAVRTIAATVESFNPPDAFNNWSLTVFTGLLAYDWLRVLIWFDHMGLRVATLVNLTFIGGDRADEKAAYFAGHAARTRIIPEGIRRFATWAPLLIPFYIPRGADWDKAWTGAERMQAMAPPLPIIELLGFYVLAALVACGIAGLIARRWDSPRSPAGPSLPGVPRAVSDGPARLKLANGFMTLELQPDGRGYTQLEGMARSSFPIDLTRRPTDALQLRGPFFYLREAEGPIWSIGYEPMRIAGADYEATQPWPNCINLRNTVEDICAEAHVSLSDEGCLEIWRLRLSNRAQRPRRILLTSFLELALHEPGSYVRDPDFNAMHVQTWFVRRLNAILARNRLLHDPATGRTSHEMMFHAAATGSGVTLVGYEDSRTRFIGSGEIRAPQGLANGRPRALDDEGSLYTFDPAASLTIAVDLPANGSREVAVFNGHASTELIAASKIAARAGIAPISEAELSAALTRTRVLEPLPALAAATWPFSFSQNGTELRLTHRTPRPWAHLLANAAGHGAIVSNEGEIHSFSGNERQNGLTPYNFESVPTSLPGQLIYVVDLDTGEADTAGYVPFRRPDAHYEVTYGLGTVVFRNVRRGIELELTFFVVPVGSADMRLLTIHNRTDRAKEFRVVPYFDIALGESPMESLGHLQVVRDEAIEALLFNNPANDFHKGWAVVATSLTAATTETVRNRFIGSKGRDLTNPVMVETGRPDGSREDDGRRVAAFSGIVKVPAHGEVDVAVVLAQTSRRHIALNIASDLRDPAAARSALQGTRAWWAERLNAVRIETNHPAFDRLVNHWLPYQVLASRLWGRSGPNQRGGAFGFRDQLQDVLPFLFFDPNLARRQIVLHASQQFPEGDVLKWWHAAPDGRTGVGQRTRASDPHLWLPYVVARYLGATGDGSVLDERVPYLQGPPVPPGASDLFMAPRASREIGTVYEHCRRAIDFALAHMGAHGLPLIGAGDWNDSIDHAGAKGRGESVWMGFFLHDILTDFGEVVRDRGQGKIADRYRAEADRLKVALEGAWLGDRYVLAYTDEGEIIAPASAMVAAWPILSRAVDFERGRLALEEALKHLEKEDRILLNSPPFDEHSDPYPGRVVDYPPGVRENGGQYSHGASWIVDAYVRLAEMADERGDEKLAAHFMERAFTCWIKISPIGKTEGERLAVYGLAPHQQAADIYDGPGYAGRGGWSWYTGSAARMLSAAYAILGLKMKNGEIIAPEDLFSPKNGLGLQSIHLKGRRLRAPILPPQAAEEEERV